MGVVVFRFLATVTEGGKGFCLMGSNEVERGQVDSWLEACWNEARCIHIYMTINPNSYYQMLFTCVPVIFSNNCTYYPD